MKILRTASIVVMIIGIFVWFLIPLVSAGMFRSSDGFPAASIVFYGDSEYYHWNNTPFYEIANISAILLGGCLLFYIFSKSFLGIGICSGCAIVALLIDHGKASDSLDTISAQITGVGFSVGFFLLIGVFGILFALSVISFCKVNDVLRVLSFLIITLIVVVWFFAPFISFDFYQDTETISAVSLVSGVGLEHLPALNEVCESSSLNWMPIVSAVLLGVCLLLTYFKKPLWVVICATAAIISLIVGNRLSPSLDSVAMHLGIGFYLLTGLFVVLAGISILYFCPKNIISSLEIT